MREWREDHGGFIRTIPRACGWMFFGLFASCAAEFLLVWIARRAARPWLPLGFAWLWRRFYV